ncbi:MAG: hypothetical protein WA087_00950 [Candidatus Saccharimonadales bacterium]
MSEIKLPPQESPADTSNWDNRAFSAPKITSVDKVKKSIERRTMILNAPERKKQRTSKNPDIAHKKKS